MIKVITVLVLILASISIHAADGKVLLIKGGAQLLRGDNLLIVKKGMQIFYGDTIAVDKKGIALLSMGKKYKTQIKVSGGTQFKIVHTVIKKTAVNVTKYLLNQGSLLFDHKSGKRETMEVITKNASMGVRGTKFFTFHHDGNTSIAMDNGLVVVSTNKTQKNLKQGDNSTAFFNGSFDKKPEQKWSSSINWDVDPLSSSIMHGSNLFMDLKEKYKKFREDYEKTKKNLNDDYEQKRKRLLQSIKQ